jgi:hypothetical protein
VARGAPPSILSPTSTGSASSPAYRGPGRPAPDQATAAAAAQQMQVYEHAAVTPAACNGSSSSSSSSWLAYKSSGRFHLTRQQQQWPPQTADRVWAQRGTAVLLSCRLGPWALHASPSSRSGDMASQVEHRKGRQSAAATLLLTEAGVDNGGAGPPASRALPTCH